MQCKQRSRRVCFRTSPVVDGYWDLLIGKKKKKSLWSTKTLGGRGGVCRVGVSPFYVRHVSRRSSSRRRLIHANGSHLAASSQRRLPVRECGAWQAPGRHLFGRPCVAQFERARQAGAGFRKDVLTITENGEGEKGLRTSQRLTLQYSVKTGCAIKN